MQPKKIERPLARREFRAWYNPSYWISYGNKSRLWNSLLVGFPVLEDFLAGRLYSGPALLTDREDMK